MSYYLTCKEFNNNEIYITTIDTPLLFYFTQEMKENYYNHKDVLQFLQDYNDYHKDNKRYQVDEQWLTNFKILLERLDVKLHFEKLSYIIFEVEFKDKSDEVIWLLKR